MLRKLVLILGLKNSKQLHDTVNDTRFILKNQLTYAAAGQYQVGKSLIKHCIGKVLGKCYNHVTKIPLKNRKFLYIA